jgi:hypothetical protein
VTASDSVAVGLTEAATSSVAVLSADTAAIGLTESPLGSITAIASDNLPIGLTESSSVDNGTLSQLTASDSVSVVVREAEIAAFELNVIDAQAVGLTEAATVVDVTNNKTATDSLKAGLSESAFIAATGVASDSVAVVIAEPTSYSQNVATYDALSIGITESAIAVIRTTAADTASVVIAESSSVSAGENASVAGSDLIAIRLSEAPFVSVAGIASDTVAVSVGGVPFVSVMDSVSEGVPVGLSESSSVQDVTSGTTSKSTSDSFAAIIDEAVRIASAGVASESQPVTLTESTVTLVYVATSDSIAVTASDATQSVRVTLQASDTLPAGFAEAAFESIAYFVSDGVQAVLDETTVVLNRFAASDTQAVIVTESASVEIAGGLVSKTGNESLAVSITEQGVVVTRTVGGISVLVATATYLSPVRTVDILTPIHTVNAIDLPHTADLVAIQEL